MTNIELSNYWLESSEEDYDTMKVLYHSGKYTWSLFVGHLVIEKLLKAIYAKKIEDNPVAPKTHNLILLSQKSEMEVTEDMKDKIKIINTFNISARYDDYKKEFQKKCDFDYTTTQIANIKEVRKWLKEQLM